MLCYVYVLVAACAHVLWQDLEVGWVKFLEVICGAWFF